MMAAGVLDGVEDWLLRRPARVTGARTRRLQAPGVFPPRSRWSVYPIGGFATDITMSPFTCKCLLNQRNDVGFHIEEATSLERTEARRGLIARKASLWTTALMVRNTTPEPRPRLSWTQHDHFRVHVAAMRDERLACRFSAGAVAAAPGWPPGYVIALSVLR